MAGVAITAATWLKRRGEFEKAILVVQQLHDRGDEEIGEPLTASRSALYVV